MSRRSVRKVRHLVEAGLKSVALDKLVLELHEERNPTIDDRPIDHLDIRLDDDSLESLP